ncbi:MAG TPA: PQQ-dependent sugar dehydrogenase, partial [Pirellulaceae bacterium]|nr:PQQ-dependent sugar dehydrogenase [Pirellulaceae bacterium]
MGPGEMFVIQKGDGKVRWVKDGAILGTVLDLNVNNASERGGLGIAADPNFATNHWVYVYYSLSTKSSDTAGSSEWVDNRVERYEWNGAALVNVFGPLVAFPMISSGDGPNHDGGVIRFGPDGKLYGVTGDLNRGRFGGGNERVEQNTAKAGSASVGGVFRINADGTIPADNPFTGEADTSFHLWWSYGLRNSFGLTFDPTSGSMWDTENGPNLYDEVNLVPKGMNSGWLKIMGPDARDAKYGENNNTKFDASDLTYLQNATYVEPILSFKTPVGITAITFLATKRFPHDLWNDCLFGDNNNGSLYLMDMKSNRADFKLPTGLTDRVVDNSGERNRIVWGSSWNVPADAQIGADGYLYVASLNGNKIVRVRPVT